MIFDSLTAQELVQHVWATAPERTQLELVLAERLQQALDAIEGGDFGSHD